MWICKKCQNQNEENFKFCWSCGFSKAKSRKTVSGNTTELTFNKKVESAEKEIPQVKKLDPEPRKQEIKIKKEKPVEVEVRTKEEPLIDDDAEILTHQKPAKQKVKKESKKKTSKIIEPEIFSTLSPDNRSANVAEEYETDWQTNVFTIAVRLIGLYFLLQVILLIPELFWFIYLIAVKGQPLFTAFPEFFESALFFFIAKFLFYLILGIYLIANGNLVIRLLPNK